MTSGGMGNDLARKIMNAVAKMGSIFGKNLNPEALQHWAEKLMPYAERSYFDRVMSDACDGNKMPSVNELLETLATYRGQRSSSEINLPAKVPLKTEEGIKSVMAMHYLHDWKIDAYLLSEAFPGDKSTIIERAKIKYTAEDISKWLKSLDEEIDL